MSLRQKQKEDDSNLILLAEVCCKILKEITNKKKKEHEERLDHLRRLFQSIPRTKRTKVCPSHCRSNTNYNLKKDPSHCHSDTNHNLKKDEESVMTSLPLRCSSSIKEESQSGDQLKIEIPVARAATPPTAAPSNKKRKQATAATQSKKKIKGADDNEQHERPTSIPTWVDELVRTHLDNAQPPLWICNKELTRTDIGKHYNRVFIPRACFRENILPALTEEEKEMLQHGISVMGLDQHQRTWDLNLKFWPKIKEHVLSKKWYDLVNANQFVAIQDTIQVWLCRYRKEGQAEERLCFLIGRKEQPNAQQAVSEQPDAQQAVSEHFDAQQAVSKQSDFKQEAD